MSADISISKGSCVFWSVNPNGDGLFCGDQWERLTGQSPARVCAWGWADAFHSDDRNLVLDAIRSGEPLDLFARVLTTDGETRWHLVRSAPEGAPGACLLIDVHALKVEALRLASMHAKLELAAQAGGIGFWTRDLAQNRTDPVLPSGIGHFDFDAWAESVHPEDRFGLLERTLRSLESDGSFEAEYRVIVNNQIHWVSTTGRILEDASGQPIELMGVALDITDRKQREITDREDRERLRLAMQAAQAGAWEWVISTGETKWSPEYYDLMGLGWEALPSVDAWMSVIHPEDRERARLEAGQGFADSEMDMEYRIVHPRKGVRWINTRGKVLSGNNRPARMFGVSIDVTERRFMEEALRESARDLERRVEARTSDLIAAMRDMDEFSYTVAHDLRAPLRAIISASRILIEDCGDRLNSSEIEQLERQAAAARRMGLLIDDLLEMAKLARTELTRYDFDVSRLVQEIAEELGVEQPGRIVSLDIEPGLRAYADPRLARIALRNLLENAVKFAKPEGASIEITRTASDGFETIRIADHGVGFDESYMNRLFRPFERLHPSDQYPGNGIGLANVKRIVERHGGRVWAEASPDVGATFYISFGA